MIENIINSLSMIGIIVGMVLVTSMPFIIIQFKDNKHPKRNMCIDVFNGIWLLIWSGIITNIICYYTLDRSLLEVIKNLLSGKLFV